MESGAVRLLLVVITAGRQGNVCSLLKVTYNQALMCSVLQIIHYGTMLK